jgi:hypothetical protein
VAGFGHRRSLRLVSVNLRQGVGVFRPVVAAPAPPANEAVIPCNPTPRDVTRVDWSSSSETWTRSRETGLELPRFRGHSG